MPLVVVAQSALAALIAMLSVRSSVRATASRYLDLLYEEPPAADPAFLREECRRQAREHAKERMWSHII
jgi:hypothetical protein